MSIIVTGGSGFIGSNFILKWVSRTNEPVINIDKLTYVSEQDNININSENYTFFKEDINNHAFLTDVINNYKPRAIINFAAETHVDNSIEEPCSFIHSNVNGTYTILKSALEYYQKHIQPNNKKFIFYQLSTDEVFGTLSKEESSFTEESPYNPRNPYSACKASADHIAMSFYNTYGLPCVISHCSNNFGERQHCEKLIPTIIRSALRDEDIPIYGDGLNIRDWIYVEDHCDAVLAILEKDLSGSKFNIGANNELSNIELTKIICDKLDRIKSKEKGGSYSENIKFVNDRKGHDFRYALNCSKIKSEIGWSARTNFNDALDRTINYYIDKYLKT